jgi:hypothetical protein
VEIELLIPENQAEGLQHQITEYSSGSLAMKITGEEYAPFDNE